MKKILTLATAAAACLSMSAADFQLYFRDAPVVDGATYEAGYELEFQEEYKGKTYYTWLQDSHLTLHGTVGTNLTITVATDSEIQWCWPLNCTVLSAGASSTLKGDLSSDGASLRLDKETETTDDPNPTLGNINVTVTAQATDDPATKVTVYVKMYGNVEDSSLGISSAVADGEYVRHIADNALSYNVAGTRTLALYAITGSLAARYQISGAGTINLGSLSRGIYMYTDGTHKGKLIVR